MDMEIIKRRPLIIGIAIILVMYFSSYVSGVDLLLPSFLLAAIAVGFMVNENIKTGAINGAVLGLVGGLIINVFFIVMLYVQGYGDYISSIIMTYLIYFVIEIIFAAIGGVLGALIQTETLEDVEPDSGK
jgi:hypothetical protein